MAERNWLNQREILRLVFGRFRLEFTKKSDWKPNEKKIEFRNMKCFTIFVLPSSKSATRKTKTSLSFTELAEYIFMYLIEFDVTLHVKLYIDVKLLGF